MFIKPFMRVSWITLKTESIGKIANIFQPQCGNSTLGFRKMLPRRGFILKPIERLNVPVLGIFKIAFRLRNRHIFM